MGFTYFVFVFLSILGFGYGMVKPIPLPVIECPKSCAKVFCAAIYCEFGSEMDECGCCPICLKGLGQSCAGPFQREGKCGPGLGCVDSIGNILPQFIDAGVEIGTCADRDINGNGFPGADGCPTSCAAVSCFDGSNCPFGSTTGRCGCCPVCLKGPGESCAGPFRREEVCARGLVCIDAFGNVINPTSEPNVPVGECKKPVPDHPTPSCSIDCSRVRCGRPDYLGCKFGVGLGQCGCCPACLKGPGESCGGAENEEGMCAEGLSCLNSYGSYAAGGVGGVGGVGVCRSRKVAPYS